MLLISLLVIGLGVKGGYAATGKCTVVKVDGTRMVIECEEKTKGFTQGNQIKIKSDREKTKQNK